MLAIKRPKLWLVGFVVSFALYSQLSAGSLSELSTRSFTNTGLGSDPGTVTYSPITGTITIDLSAIQGSQVFRATLDPYRDPQSFRTTTPPNSLLEPYVIQDPAGATLELVGPRYLTFEATESVKNAVDSGQLVLNVIQPGQGFGDTISLDVLCDRPAPSPISPVTTTVANCREGDVMVTFDEIDPAHLGSTWTVGGYRAAMSAARPSVAPKRRYRIYRSTTPFDSLEAVAQAELVDEITPHTGWNGQITAFDPTFGQDDPVVIPRLPVDHFDLAPPGKGIYVRRVEGDTQVSAYYLVSHTLNGAESFSVATLPASSTGPVLEESGPGLTLLWREESFDGLWFFSFVDMTLRDYVRWAQTPDWSVPGRPFNYRLGIPQGDTQVASPPLSIEPHAWGGDFTGWRSWYGYDQGAVLLTMNHQIYNSYTAFHEYFHDLRPWSEGTVQPFFWARTWDFVFSFARDTYNLDMDRIFLQGGSMGGAAVNMFGLRSGALIAYLHGVVGNVNPAEDLTWEYEQLGGYGRLSWGLPYSNEQLARYGYSPVQADSVWDYFDNSSWLEASSSEELPYITFANAPNDPVIAWNPVWSFAQAMTTTRRAHNFAWGQGGHGQGTPFFEREWRRSEPLPAFSNAGIDNDLGETPQDYSPDEGQINAHFRWNLGAATTQVQAWAIELYLAPSAPATATLTDLTLRKLPVPFTEPLASYNWQFREASQVIDEGGIIADEGGLLTWTDLEISTTPRTLELWLVPESTCGDTNGDSLVNLADPVDLLNRLFAGTGDLGLQADANNDGTINLADAIYLLNFLFLSGPAPSC